MRFDARGSLEQALRRRQGKSGVSMRFDARGSLERVVVGASHNWLVSMRFDARGSLEHQALGPAGHPGVRFLCALTREAPWN